MNPIESNDVDWELEQWLTELTNRRARYSDPAELAERVSKRIGKNPKLRQLLHEAPDAQRLGILKRMVRTLDYRRPAAWRAEIALEDAELDRLMAKSMPVEPTETPPLQEVADAVEAVLVALGLDNPKKEDHLALFGTNILLLSSPAGQTPAPPGEVQRRKAFINFLNYRGVLPQGARTAPAKDREDVHRKRVETILDERGVSPTQAIEFCTRSDVFTLSRTLSRAVVSGGSQILAHTILLIRSAPFRAAMQSRLDQPTDTPAEMLSVFRQLVAGMYAGAEASTPFLLGALLELLAETLGEPQPRDTAVEWLRDRSRRLSTIRELNSKLVNGPDIGRWAAATALGQHYVSEGAAYSDVEAELREQERRNRSCPLGRMGAGVAMFALASDDARTRVPSVWRWIHEAFTAEQCSGNYLFFPMAASQDFMGSPTGARFVAQSDILWSAVDELLASPNAFAHVTATEHVRRIEQLGLGSEIPDGIRTRIDSLPTAGAAAAPLEIPAE